MHGWYKKVPMFRGEKWTWKGRNSDRGRIPSASAMMLGPSIAFLEDPTTLWLSGQPNHPVCATLLDLFIAPAT